MLWLGIFLSALLGGLVQSITGFGAAIVMMSVVPYFFNMLQAPALSSSITAGLSCMLAWKFRRDIDFRQAAAPTLLYLVFSTAAIGLAPFLDLELLAVVFGAFLILLSVYFLFFAQGVSIKANLLTASVCSIISGVCAGFFGIGGPLMAIYFLAATQRKESYIGCIQFMFAVNNIANLAVRAACGIYTLALIPFTLVGLAGICLGKIGGLRVLERINPKAMKKIVYIYVGVSGVMTLADHLL